MEPTKNYIKLVLAPQVGQGIMQNTVGENQSIKFEFNEHDGYFKDLCPLISQADKVCIPMQSAD